MKVASFGERLKEALEIKNVSRSELGRRTGFNRQVIYQYLNGQTVPRSVNVEKIAKALNVDVAYLMGFDVDIHGRPIDDVMDIRVENIHADNLNRAIGQAMKQLRTSKHISIEEMARTLGRSVRTLEDFENNKKQVVALTIARYCKHLDYDVRSMLEDIIFIFDELENK